MLTASLRGMSGNSVAESSRTAFSVLERPVRGYPKA